ncbi:MAG: Sua5/YciO/YrdC/YwlC family protein [Gammaproteobacteria bacterium]|nr:Sua5/YciO/YrdC/YwlC family protein [Gammaproteobacteria bacterium]
MVSPFIIRKTALAIKQGELVAYPTEAVFGLGCDPYQHAAVQRLLTLKQRPVEKGLILVASDLQQLDDFIEPLTEQQIQTISRHANTSWVVPAKNAPIWLRGKHDTLAIRLSAHPLVRTLCDYLQQPVVSTSANPAGRNPARNSLHCHQYFQHELAIIINSETGSLAQPTEIRNLLTQQIIRAN